MSYESIQTNPPLEERYLELTVKLFELNGEYSSKMGRNEPINGLKKKIREIKNEREALELLQRDGGNRR